MPEGKSPPVLVTGATGYIGGRLVPELLAAKMRPRVMARSQRNMANHDWYGNVALHTAVGWPCKESKTVE